MTNMTPTRDWLKNAIVNRSLADGFTLEVKLMDGRIYKLSMEADVTDQYGDEIYLTFSRRSPVPMVVRWRLVACRRADIPDIATTQDMCDFVNKFEQLNWTPVPEEERCQWTEG